MKRATLFAALIASLLLTGLVVARTNQTPSVEWDVVSGSGVHLEQGNVRLMNTLGQPVVGSDSSGTTVLCSGYWCRPTEVGFDIFLPVVLRQA